MADDRALKIGMAAKRRLRAILLDVVQRGMKSQTALRVLEQQFVEDPMTFLERLDKLLPADPVQQVAGPALSLNVAFLDAVRSAPIAAAQAMPALELKTAQPDTEW